MEYETKVSYSLLSAEYLAAEVAQRYELAAGSTRLTTPAYIRFYSRGSNDIFLLQANGASYALRVSPVLRTPESVEIETDLLAQMAKSGLTVCAAVAQRDGSLYFSVAAPEGRRCCVVFPFINGQENMPLRTPDQGFRIGMATGAFHRWGDGADPPGADKISVPALNLDQSWIEQLPIDGSERDFLGRACQETQKRLYDPARKWDRGLCHGDLVDGNTITTADGRTWLFDFEYCGVGLRGYDLATLWDSIEEDSRAEVWDAFVKGYQSERPLGLDDIDHRPLFSVARQVWLIAAQQRIATHWGWLWERDRMRDNLRRLRQLWNGVEAG